MKYALIIIATVFIVGCGEEKFWPTPKFSPGEMVESIVSGQQDMVVDTRCYKKNSRQSREIVSIAYAFPACR